MNKLSVLFAVLAAVAYGVSAPLAKLLLAHISASLLAALLYLGAGIGMTVVLASQGRAKTAAEARLTRSDAPYAVGMIVLDIAAPLLLLFGLKTTTAETASLLGNFEIVATSLIALLLFKEAIGNRMWLAIALITAASIILSVEDFSQLQLSPGSLLVLAAGISWGLENNLTSKLSLKNPLQIVLLKGFGSGLGALLIAFLIQDYQAAWAYVPFALLLGFVSFGLSIYFYIRAQRGLGAARTAALYAIAPFIGVATAFLVFRDLPRTSFFVALMVMAAGTYLAVSERHDHEHTHHPITHDHRHRHDDGHHDHHHDEPVVGEHSHVHTHDKTTHCHPHSPDLHHRHRH